MEETTTTSEVAVPTTAELVAELFPVETEEASAVPVEEVKAVEVVAPVPVEDPVAKLVKRESEIQAQRKALDQERVAWKAEQTALQAKAKDNLLARLKDPYSAAAALKEAGVTNLGDYAKILWAEDLGDLAPAEYRQQKTAKTLEQKLAELEAKLVERDASVEQARNQQEVARQVDAYVTGLVTLASSEAAATQFPHVQAFATLNPQSSRERLHRVAENIARSRLEAGINEPPTHEEVCTALESVLAEMAPVYKPRQAAVPAQAVAAQSVTLPRAVALPSRKADPQTREQLRAEAMRKFKEDMGGNYNE